MVDVVVSRDKHDGVEELEAALEKRRDLTIGGVSESLAVDDIAEHDQVARTGGRALLKRV